jgi:uncharacterized RDD family membrane protein YckC
MLATWISRVGATLIDGLIAGIPAGILIVIGSVMLSSENGSGLGGVLLAVGYLFALAFQVWNLGYKQGTTGQSIGKGVLGIKVVRESDGQPLGFGMSIVRIILYGVLGGLCVGILNYLWPLWDAKRQTWTDKILSSLVIKV